jgi:hypothetical protein
MDTEAVCGAIECCWLGALSMTIKCVEPGLCRTQLRIGLVGRSVPFAH